MAESKLETEVIQILTCIQHGENFLLSGGAGSGKTYSLVQVISEAIKRNPIAQVACMTYTNAAVREIEDRVNHPNLSVTTIHDFLWENIKSYQKELKKALISLINDENSTITSSDGIVHENYFDLLPEGIQYREWTKIKEGVISHDEVIEVANYMFKNYRVLSRILKDKFKYIFIDEYQDTNPLVIEILLEHLTQSNNNCVIGFFGDSMQAIYDDGVGDLKRYVDGGIVKEIRKEQNRRNPKSIIHLANQLRNDGLNQIPSTDVMAPNMEDGQVILGEIKFIQSEVEDLNTIKSKIGWNFSNSKETKELNLTHNLIAPQAGFLDLMDIYSKDPIIGLKNDILKRMKDNIKNGVSNPDIDINDTFEAVIDKMALKNVRRELKKDIILKDHLSLFNELRNLQFEEVKKIYIDREALIDDKKQHEGEDSKKGSKRDNLIKHLFKIQLNISLYKEKNYNEFIRRTEYRIIKNEDKKTLKIVIENLTQMFESTIEEVINYADNFGICKKDDLLNNFVTSNIYLYNRIKGIKFGVFQSLYNYLEGYTPFSTQHKIKGAQFDNVLVVLDNGGWNNYNFEYLLNDSVFQTLTPAKKNSYPEILSRTQKIFYVCCTRAKKNLVVVYRNNDQKVTEKAIEWFGEKNVITI